MVKWYPCGRCQKKGAHVSQFRSDIGLLSVVSCRFCHRAYSTWASLDRHDLAALLLLRFNGYVENVAEYRTAYAKMEEA